MALLGLVGLHLAVESLLEILPPPLGLDHEPGEESSPVPGLMAVVGASIVLVSFWCYQAKHEKAKAFVLATLALGTALGAAGTIRSIPVNPAGAHLAPVIGAVYFLLCGCCSWLLTAALKKQPPRVRLRRVTETRVEARPHLVVLLSLVEPNRWPDVVATGRGSLGADVEALRQAKRVGSPAVPARSSFWSWEPLLTAVHAHVGPLESITVIPSRASDRRPGSISLLPWMVEVLQRYAQELPNVTIQAWLRGANAPVVVGPGQRAMRFEDIEGTDFENFDELSTTMNGLLRYFTEHDIGEEQIAFDITGGQKPTTTVAALATCNSLIAAQYVQTNEPWQPLQYDIVIEWEAPAG